MIIFYADHVNFDVPFHLRMIAILCDILKSYLLKIITLLAFDVLHPDAYIIIDVMHFLIKFYGFIFLQLVFYEKI